MQSFFNTLYQPYTDQFSVYFHIFMIKLTNYKWYQPIWKRFCMWCTTAVNVFQVTFMSSPPKHLGSTPKHTQVKLPPLCPLCMEHLHSVIENTTCETIKHWNKNATNYNSERRYVHVVPSSVLPSSCTTVKQVNTVVVPFYTFERGKQCNTWLMCRRFY
jgi:hypothetical protein